MNILLDENLPEGLIELGLKGLANGPLYREVASGYDLFFTKDREFAARVEALPASTRVRVILTVIRQQPEAQFIAEFLKAFASTDQAV